MQSVRIYLTNFFGASPFSSILINLILNRHLILLGMNKPTFFALVELLNVNNFVSRFVGTNLRTAISL